MAVSYRTIISLALAANVCALGTYKAPTTIVAEGTTTNSEGSISYSGGNLPDADEDAQRVSTFLLAVADEWKSSPTSR